MTINQMDVCIEETVLGKVEYLSGTDYSWQRFEYNRMFLPTKEITTDVVYCHCLKDALALVMKWNAADPRWKYWM